MSLHLLQLVACSSFSPYFSVLVGVEKCLSSACSLHVPSEKDSCAVGSSRRLSVRLTEPLKPSGK